LPNEFPPFRLERKASLCKPPTKYHSFRRAIRRVEYVRPKPVQCISVAHPNQLYVTDHFVATHNTVVALWALLCAVQTGMQGAIMAPTGVLAAQHGIHRGGRGGPLGGGGGLFGGPRVEVLTAATTGASRQRILDGGAAGEVHPLARTPPLLPAGGG